MTNDDQPPNRPPAAASRAAGDCYRSLENADRLESLAEACQSLDPMLELHAAFVRDARAQWLVLQPEDAPAAAVLMRGIVLAEAEHVLMGCWA